MRQPWPAQQQAGGGWREPTQWALRLPWLLRNRALAGSARIVQRLDMRKARSVQQVSSPASRGSSGQPVAARLTTVKMAG